MMSGDNDDDGDDDKEDGDDAKKKMMIDMHDDERPRQKNVRGRSRCENEISAAQVSRGVQNLNQESLNRPLDTKNFDHVWCPEVELGIPKPTSGHPCS